MPCSNDTKILILLMKIFFYSKGREGSDYFCSSNFTHMARGNSVHRFLFVPPFACLINGGGCQNILTTFFVCFNICFKFRVIFFYFFAIKSVKYSLKKWLVMAWKWLQKGPKIQNLPGRCPWTPLGGLRTPPRPPVR